MEDSLRLREPAAAEEDVWHVQAPGTEGATGAARATVDTAAGVGAMAAMGEVVAAVDVLRGVHLPPIVVHPTGSEES